MEGLHTQLRVFDFSVSLRLRHPFVHHDEISRQLGVEPRFKWDAGQPRVGRDGRKLGGVHDQTYWVRRMEKVEESSLPVVLSEGVRLLEAHRDFLRTFIETGGEAELFVGWFTSPISGGTTLDSTLLGRIADLGLNLSLDVYDSK